MVIPLILVTIGLFSLGLAAIVWLASTNSKAVKILFGFMSLMMSVWALGLAGFLMSQDPVLARLFSRIFYLAAATFTPLMLLFALYYPAPKKGVPAALLLPVLASSALINYLILFSDNFIIESISFSDKLVISVDRLSYIAFASLFVFYFFAAILVGLYRLRNLRKKPRQQVKWYLIAIILTSIPGFYANLILPYHNNYSYVWVGPVAVILFLGIIGFSIVKHQMFDLKLAAVRTVAYVLSLLTLAGVYFGLAYIVSSTLFKGASTTGVSVSPVNIILALVLAFVFQPIKHFFDRATNAVFYRDRYNSDEFMARVGVALTSTTDLRTLLRRVGNEIASTLKAKHATFVVVREDALPLTMGSTDHAPRLKVAEVEELRELFTISEVYRRDGDNNHDKLDRWLKKRSFHIVVPLGDSVGWLMLGEPKAGAYASRDLRVLKAISSELMIAIQNSRSVQVVKELNAHLQQRVDTATRDLRASNERLRKLDETKDEFVSMASHQLRTPLTSIKGYISMLLEGDGGKITPQQDKLLKEAFTSSERMVRLISDFLNVSRLQTGKFMVDPHPVDLARVIGDEIASMRMLAKSHGLSLYYDGPKSLPDVMIDEDKTRQVIMNFIDNAIYYSHEGTDIVVRLSTARGHVVLEVRDQGIGVPKKEQAQLFGKFFRAENARRQRPDGTGVGLFLAKRVIEAQGGEIIFHSRPGMGSVFGFRLPLKK